ncbi:LuxR C-terminal-related transcriptional regulator [Nocardia africana]|uniref:Predicted ATPase n=1 Tax=Nocardia africana TaxID=134964 RepID=A0A378WPS7_9NOCA|nr:AAA family ATPase [Nocardia africana]MCC3315265.1 AAA family ATPase [Nocardia africana]SUA42434.1 Predicted ATPase [Nocardia africana]
MFQRSRIGVLPATSSEFVGRRAQRERITALIARGARLITLTGPGGIGKTRLAIETLRRDVDLPTRWLALAELDGDTAIAELRDFAPRPDGAPHILVLDSCDRLVSALAPELADLLEADPALTVVATSREPIGWIDEQLVPVPSLDPAQALRLLRIRMELTGRTAGAEDDDILRRICAHMSHNPFGLRLAAIRLRHHPPAIVLHEVSGDAYDRRLQWSDSARVGVEARHRDIGANIAWSTSRCSPAESLLLQRMSVFPGGSAGGGADREAIVAICADDALPEASIESTLDRLVERSLVIVRLTGTSARWYLTECVRLVARAELHRRDPVEANRLAARHLQLRRLEVRRAEGAVPQQPCVAAAPPPAETVAVPRPESDRWESLSRAEREVAVLAAAGWPNSAIAVRRHSSVRTVDAQVAMVRQKLQITSRGEIARHLPAEARERMRCEARARREKTRS